MTTTNRPSVPESRLAEARNLLVAGHSVADVAERLGITHGQARYAEKIAMRRAGVRRRGDLMRAHGNTEPAVPHANRTPLDVQRAIVARRKRGETNQAIALQYGLSESGVSRIYWRALKAERAARAAEEREVAVQR